MFKISTILYYKGFFNVNIYGIEKVCIFTNVVYERVGEKGRTVKYLKKLVLTSHRPNLPFNKSNSDVCTF